MYFYVKNNLFTVTIYIYLKNVRSFLLYNINNVYITHHLRSMYNVKYLQGTDVFFMI